MNPSKQLLNDCLKDNRKAHYELYKVCFPFILSVCRRYYRNKEESMATLNLAFLKIIQNLGGYIRKDHIPFDLWVRRICINTIIDEFRKQDSYKRIFDLSGADQIDSLQITDEKTENYIDREEILIAVNQLPEMNRTVFNLYVIDGYKHEEIAGLLGISPSTSKVHLFRARKILRGLIDEVKKNNSIKSILS